jgi:hypothetical protein
MALNLAPCSCVIVGRLTDDQNPILTEAAVGADAAAAARDPSATEAAAARRADRMELAAAVILATATVLAAWAAYQATRWSGVQASAYNLGVTKRTDAAQATSVFAAETLIDIQVWLSWLQQVADQDEEAATFLEERMPDTFKPAFDAWLAQVPEGEIPPGTPFEMDAYGSPSELEILRLNDEADALIEEAHRANQIADDFVLTAVIMALVLFFAGVATRFEDRRIRGAMLGLAVVILVGGVAFTLSMPQNVPF